MFTYIAYVFSSEILRQENLFTSNKQNMFHKDFAAVACGTASYSIKANLLRGISQQFVWGSGILWALWSVSDVSQRTVNNAACVGAVKRPYDHDVSENAELALPSLLIQWLVHDDGCDFQMGSPCFPIDAA